MQLYDKWLDKNRKDGYGEPWEEKTDKAIGRWVAGACTSRRAAEPPLHVCTLAAHLRGEAHLRAEVTSRVHPPTGMQPGRCGGKRRRAGCRGGG